MLHRELMISRMTELGDTLLHRVVLAIEYVLSLTLPFYSHTIEGSILTEILFGLFETQKHKNPESLLKEINRVGRETVRVFVSNQNDSCFIFS